MASPVAATTVAAPKNCRLFMIIVLPFGFLVAPNRPNAPSADKIFLGRRNKLQGALL
jgi:hypothetical protein